jgi:hypothetical protein
MHAGLRAFFADPASWFSLAALAVAGVSALYTIRSSRATQKQARLAEQTAEVARARPEVELIDRYWRRASDLGQRVYAVYARVMNPASSPVTLLCADLRIRFRNRAAELTVLVPCSMGAVAPATRWKSTPLVFPVSIAAKGAVVGHLLFDDTGLVPASARIESYQLVFRDVTRADVTADMFIVLEEVSAPHGESPDPVQE